MTALALSDEDPPGRDLQVAQSQTQDLTAAQPTQHHRLHHRPVAVGAQRRQQRVDLARIQDPGSVRGVRTSGTPCRGRWRSRRVGSPRGTGFAATSPRATQEPEQTRHARQAAAHRPRRHPGHDPRHRLQPTQRAARVLRRDEPEHVG